MLAAATPTVVHVHTGSSWLEALSIGLAALTVLLAFGALVYARKTVGIAEAQRGDTVSAHREEMAERARVADVELRIHRITRAERTLAVVLQIREAAIAAQNGGPGQLRYPALATELRAAMAALGAIGGPKLPDSVELATVTAQGGTPSPQIQTYAQTAMWEIETTISSEPSLRLNGAESYLQG